MHRVLILNSKGGCGKTTVATNLAGYYAHKGFKTALLDYDPQGSSTFWLSKRTEKNAKIHGITAFNPNGHLTRSWQLRKPAQIDMAFIDAPAGVSGFQLIDYLQRVDTILIPVLPSPVDIHATAHFIEKLITVGKARSRGIQLGVIANRVRENTIVYRKLQLFLERLELPFLTSLKDSQSYIHASEKGLSIHELELQNIKKCREQWLPLIKWIDSVEIQEPEQPSQSSFPTMRQA